MRLDEIFMLSVAKSGGTKDYLPGRIPFVSSSEMNNGVVSYVDPLPGDKVFDGPALVVSGLGFATVHLDRFLPKGNGGDSLTVLVPNQPMTTVDLVAAAATFNALHSWRFSFGRKTSFSRLSLLEMPFPFPDVTEAIRADVVALDELSCLFLERVIG